MKKLIFLTLVCSFLLSNKGYGQQDSYISVQYAVSFGTGDLSDYVSKASFRGALLEYRGDVTTNIMLGFDAGWNVFYEKKNYDTYSRGTESLSGIQFRYQNVVPLLVSADYLILTEGPLKPYVGLGIGTMYSERSTEMNLYAWQQKTWQFAVKGEVGLLYEISYSSSIKFAAKYYNGFKTGTLDNQGYVSLSLGMAWSL